jgi:hypothetical protein
MTRTEILNEFEHMSIRQQLELMSAALQILQKRFREMEQTKIVAPGKLPLAEAAHALRNDYMEDKELTSFTALDREDFYG